MGNAKITPIIPKNIFIVIHLLSIKECVICANPIKRIGPVILTNPFFLLPLIHGKYLLHGTNHTNRGLFCHYTDFGNTVSFSIHRFNFSVVIVFIPLISFCYHIKYLLNISFYKGICFLCEKQEAMFP